MIGIKKALNMLYRFDVLDDEGDGAKYGWKSDASLLADASHYGFKAVKLKG